MVSPTFWKFIFVTKEIQDWSCKKFTRLDNNSTIQLLFEKTSWWHCFSCEKRGEKQKTKPKLSRVTHPYDNHLNLVLSSFLTSHMKFLGHRSVDPLVKISLGMKPNVSGQKYTVQLKRILFYVKLTFGECKVWNEFHVKSEWLKNSLISTLNIF